MSEAHPGRASGASHGRPTGGGPAAPATPLLALVPLGLVLALPMAALAFGEVRGALLGLAALGALVGGLAVWVWSRRRLADLMLVGMLALVTVPVDRYFAYREHVGGWPGLRLAASDLLLLPLAALALLALLAGRRLPALPRPVLVLYLLWVAWYAVSALGAPERALSLFEIASALHALLVASVVAALFTRRHVPAVLWTLAGLVLVHTLFAAAQVATGRPIGIGLGAAPAEVMVEQFRSGGAAIRPAGLFDHPIVYANFLMVSLPVLVAGFVLVQGRAARGALGAAVAAGLAGLALTLSRGAWLSSAVAGAVGVVLASRHGLLDVETRRRLTRAALVAALAGAVVFGPRIYERLTASMEGNLEVRFELNEIAFRMIAAHPFTGVGVNHFIPVMDGYDPEGVMEYFPATVHNVYLLEASEAGLPALLLFVGIWIAIARGALARLDGQPDPALRALAVAVLAGLAGFLFSQLADFSHRLEPLRTLLWALVGVLFGSLAAGRGRAAEPRS